MVTFCWLLLHIASQAFSSALTMQPREFLCSHSQNILDALSMCGRARHFCWLWLMAFCAKRLNWCCAHETMWAKNSRCLGPLNDNLSRNVNCFPIPSARASWLKESRIDFSLCRGLKSRAEVLQPSPWPWGWGDSTREVPFVLNEFRNS